MTNTLYLARPRGFCAGVNRAIKIVERALGKYKNSIYVNHEIVHNRFVVENFKKQGVVFTDNLEAVPDDAVYIFSAHGVSPQFRAQVQAKNLKIIDATCPLVTKVHTETEMFMNQGYKIFYIGKKNNQEYLGVAGVGDMELIENGKDIGKIEIKKYKDQKVVCLSQTTLSESDTKKLLEKLKEKIPHLRIPGDICYATQNRQNAVKELAKVCDFIVVIGSQNSSNSNKLVSVAEKSGVKAGLFENVETLFTPLSPSSEGGNIIEYYEKVGITSGASVPEVLVEEVIEEFKKQNKDLEIEEIKVFDETVEFEFPDEVK